MSTPPYPPNPDDPEPGRPADGPPRYVPSGNQSGTGPYGAEEHGGPRADVPPPPEVNKLLTLTLASAAIYLLNQLLGLIAGTDVAQMSQEIGLSSQEATIAEQAVAMRTVGTIVVMVIAAALYGVVYVFLKKRKNWARVLGVVLAILSVVSTVVGILGALAYGGPGLITLLLGTVFAVVNILWLVTAFKAPVKAWYNPYSAM